MTDPDPWLSVADVMAELNLSKRQAWALLCQLGVPVVCAVVRDRINGARFRRSDWQAALERARRPEPSPMPSGPAPQGRRRVAALPTVGGKVDLRDWRKLKREGAGR